MEYLVLENFRCFRERLEIPLAPLTILVGENSTGKSSFLAATSLAWPIAQFLIPSDFNVEPFDLGAYEQIAFYRGGRSGRAPTFSIGIKREFSPKRTKKNKKKNHDAVITVQFKNIESQPLPKEWKFSSGKSELRITFTDQSEVDSIDMRFSPKDKEPYVIYSKEAESGKKKKRSLFGFTSHVPFSWVPDVLRNRLDLLYHSELELDTGTSAALKKSKIQETREAFSSFDDLYRWNVQPFAPIRTEPKRTYDPKKENPEIKGLHTPMVLSKALKKGSEDDLQKNLVKFGEASGLFSGIKARSLGPHGSDPFQIQIKALGQFANLMDVGYGVSQILPIIVDILRGEKKEQKIYLIQQPEVHLHPRAQAEFGSLLVTATATNKQRFVVETHSDYLVDRVRSDIRDKKIDPSFVAILFFEKNKSGGVKVHDMRLNKEGNLIGAPEGYRQFFADEQDRFLGLKKEES